MPGWAGRAHFSPPPRKRQLRGRRRDIAAAAVTIAAMNKLSRLWVLLLVVPGLWAVIGGSLHAAPALDLATATVAVESQADDDRARALRAALAQVFVKLSGSRTVLANPAVAAALTQAASYATDVSYVRLPAPPVAGDPAASDADGDPAADSTIAPIATSTQPAMGLRVRFAMDALTAVLSRAEVPTWLNRPELLVVPVVDAPQGQRFGTRDSDPLVYAAMEQAMARRGVALQLPLLDLEDQTLLSPSEAWALDRDKLAAIAHRYGVGHWLVLRYRDPPDGAWHGFWSLGGEGDPLGRVIVADSLPELVDASVDEAVDRFSPRYARTARAIAENIDLVIENVRDFRTFGLVTDTLDALPVVTQVEVQGIEGEQLALRLTLAGDPQDLFDALGRDGHFVPGANSVGNPAADPAADPASAADLRQRWRWRAGP